MPSTVGTNVAFGWETGSWTKQWIVSSRRNECADHHGAVDCSRERYLISGPAILSRQTNWADERRHSARRQHPFREIRTLLIEELKPRVGREYRTVPGPANTGVLGSSMGGLCSVVLAWQRPDVFGKAASLSGAFQVENRHFLVNILQPYRGKPKPFKVYLDSGTTDFTGGDDGHAQTEAVATELHRIGWREGRDLLHFVDEKPLTEIELAKTGLRRDKWKEQPASTTSSTGGSGCGRRSCFCFHRMNRGAFVRTQCH